VNVGENRKNKGNKAHVLMEKLLTPIARTFPVSRSFSISAQASLKLTLSVVLTEPSGFLGNGFPSALRRTVSRALIYEGRKGLRKKRVPS
jgi:hypothetical protein